MKTIGNVYTLKFGILHGLKMLGIPMFIFCVSSDSDISHSV